MPLSAVSRRLAFSLIGVLVVAAIVCARRSTAQAPPSSQGFDQTVARVSYVQGDTSLQRGDDPDAWQPLAPNVPITIGDRVYAGDGGRLELQTSGLRAFLAPRTELTALNLTEDVQQYAIAEGTASFRVYGLDDDDVLEVDTPNAAVTLERAGLYRVYVDPDGNTRLSVRRGEARVAAGGGEVSLREGEQIVVNGQDAPEYDVYAVPAGDSWDRWVDSRERRRHAVAAFDYTSPDVVGADDLDTYGTWEDVPEYGNVWRPTAVAADWVPYRYGRWIWQDPWGWTWVSEEPWGWAPFHYGRWVVVSSRWCWVPVGPRIRHVSYAPALVAFVAGGPGWSVSVGGGGYVGWFPLGPHDPFVPWWTRPSGTPFTVTAAAYANRRYATIVPRAAFAEARPVRTARVADTQVVREVQAAPVLRAPLPVVPTRASLRAASAAPAPRPPERVLTRPVAARLAPPPAPPAFDRKVEVIRENRGAPVAPPAASTLAAASPQGARAAVPIRPVVRQDRRVDLAPQRGAEGAPPPDPVHRSGRALSTPESPLIAHPSGGREAAPPLRVAPGAVVTPAPPPAREVARRDAATSPREMPAPAREAAPPAPQAAQPAPRAAEPRAEVHAYSRPPRRVAEPGPDPLVQTPAHAQAERAAPARPERAEPPKPERPKRPEKPDGRD